MKKNLNTTLCAALMCLLVSGLLAGCGKSTPDATATTTAPGGKGGSASTAPADNAPSPPVTADDLNKGMSEAQKARTVQRKNSQ